MKLCLSKKKDIKRLKSFIKKKIKMSDNISNTIERMKPMAIILAIVPIIFILMPLVSSLTYKDNTLINLKVPCTLDGAVCSSGAFCNITIVKPDGDYLVNWKPMANGGNGIFNYSFSSSMLGNHIATVSCTENGQNATSTFNIEITKTGINDTSSFYWFVIAISMGVIILGFYLRYPYITILGTLGLYFVGIHFILYGFADRYDEVVKVTGIIITALAMIISIKSVVEVFQENYG